MPLARSSTEIRQLSTALEAVVVWLGALPGPVPIGLEATLYWDWLATRLAEHGHTVRVAHAFHVKLIWQARAKTDPIDARKLAELLRVNLFPAIWLPDLDTRERRQLLRGRAFLVRGRCANAPGSRIGFTVISPRRISSHPAPICMAKAVARGWRARRCRRCRRCSERRPHGCSRCTTRSRWRSSGSMPT